MRPLLLFVLIASLACTEKKEAAPPPPTPIPAPPASPPPPPSPSPSPTTGAETEASTLVIGKGDPCALLAVDRETGAERPLVTTGAKDCPSFIALGAGRAVYVEGDALYAHPFGQARARLAAGPWVKQTARLQVDDAGAVHIVGLSPLDESKVRTEDVNDQMRVTATIDGVEKVFDDHFLPPWGTWNLADHRVVDAKGVKLVARVPTKWEAGETPGPTVIDLPKSKVWFQEWGWGCATASCNALAVPPEALSDIFKKKMKLGEEDLADALPASDGWSLVFKIEWGDSAHPTKPFAFCTEGCAKLVELKGIDDDFPRLFADPPWFLFEHSSNERAWLFRAGQAKPVHTFEGAGFAFFVSPGL